MPDFSKRYLSPSGRAELLPMYVQDGDFIKQTTTLTDAELAALDWHALEEIGYDFDPQIFKMVDEELNIISKTITAVLEFRIDAREVMAKKIDAASEIARAQFATSYPLQTMEYAEAARQAKAYLTDPEDPNETWNFLQSDIGRTMLPNGHVVASLNEAALAIIGAEQQWSIGAAYIRDIRLEAKANIRDSESDAQAYELYSAALARF